MRINSVLAGAAMALTACIAAAVVSLPLLRSDLPESPLPWFARLFVVLGPTVAGTSVVVFLGTRGMRRAVVGGAVGVVLATIYWIAPLIGLSFGQPW